MGDEAPAGEKHLYTSVHKPKTTITRFFELLQHNLVRVGFHRVQNVFLYGRVRLRTAGLPDAEIMGNRIIELNLYGGGLTSLISTG
jgi:hypothetical protein